MTRARAAARAAAALLVLLAVLGGVPTVLVALGATPTGLPDPAGAWAALSRPDDTGGVLFTILAAGVWACWAGFTVCVAREVASAVTTRGHRPARPVRGLDWAGRPAAILVAALIGGFTTAPALMLSGATPVAAAPVPPLAHSAPATTNHGARPGPPTPDHHATDDQAATTDAAPAEEPARTRDYTIRRHDTLWDIAERELGDPLRYPQIVTLNPHLGPADRLRPGQHLTLPAAPPPTGRATNAQRVQVELGDTLSGIAAEAGVDDWRDIWPANHNRRQPGGDHFTDPDHIEPGWSILIPATSLAARHDQRPEHDGTPKPARGRRAAPAPQQAPHHQPRSRENQTGSAVPAPHQTGATRPVNQPHPNAAPDAAVHAMTGERDAWPLGGIFLGAGAVLAAAALAALTTARRAQFRTRRPGRTIAGTPPQLAGVERALVRRGSAATADVQALDAALRHLAGAVRDNPGLTLPDLVAVQVRDDAQIVLHLASACPAAPEPWWVSNDGTRWHLTPAAHHLADLPSQQQPPGGLPPKDPVFTPAGLAPFPMLVAVGSNEHGAWLLDLERAGAIAVDGDRQRCEDFARFLGADLALNPWSQTLTVTTAGFGAELADLAPERVRHTSDIDAVARELTLGGVEHADTADTLGVRAAQARAAELGQEAWPGRVLLVTGADPLGSADLATLVDLIARRPARTGTAVLLGPTQPAPPTADNGHANADADACVSRLHVDADGILTIPGHGLVMRAVQLDAGAAVGIGQLLAAARVEDDAPIPAAGIDPPWKVYADNAGALRPELTTTRPTGPEPVGDPGEEATSVLPQPDESYVAAAATTSEDLHALAPRVSAAVRHEVQDVDPDLDHDLQLWSDTDCPLPRLHLLGPVQLDAGGFEQRVGRRRAYYTELAAYLSIREHGATVEELAADFTLQPAKARAVVGVLRDWLGVNPLTGTRHLPEATKSPEGVRRGVGVFQLQGVLVDADLFRRARLRGQAKGADGMADLLTALSLVSGQPFSGLRPGGYEWLAEGTRLDQHLVCAVVDTAHLVATHMLAVGDQPKARAAAELALLAAPYEETPRLDLAAVYEAEGHPDIAAQLIRDDVCNRSDGQDAPADLSDRTQRILAERSWATRAS